MSVVDWAVIILYLSGVGGAFHGLFMEAHEWNEKLLAVVIAPLWPILVMWNWVMRLPP